jgi:hypothetical protein
VAGYALLVVTSAAVEGLRCGGLPGWALAGLAILAVPATVAAWADRLPVINSLLAGGTAAGLGALLHALDGATEWPLGGWRWGTAGGPSVLGVLPWVLPVAWFVATLAARGVARWWWLPPAGGQPRGLAVVATAGLLGAGLLIGLLAAGQRAGWCAAPAEAWWQTAATLLGAQTVLQVALTPLLLDKFPQERPPGAGPVLVLAPLVLLLLAVARG